MELFFGDILRQKLQTCLMISRLMTLHKKVCKIVCIQKNMMSQSKMIKNQIPGERSSKLLRSDETIFLHPTIGVGLVELLP